MNNRITRSPLNKSHHLKIIDNTQLLKANLKSPQLSNISSSQQNTPTFTKNGHSNPRPITISRVNADPDPLRQRKSQIPAPPLAPNYVRVGANHDDYVWGRGSHRQTLR